MAEPVTPRSTETGDTERRRRTRLVTLLFTDMVGSTALKQRLGDLSSANFFDQHHQIVRQTLAQSASGQEIETAGDSFLIIFDTPSDAVKFALLLQTRLRALSKEQHAGALDRIGIHVGEVVAREDQPAAKPRDLYGIPIDTCARIMSLAAGGQTLMSRFAFDSSRPMLRGEELGELQWLNHGGYQLKGIDEPIEVCEVRAAGNSTSPPTSNEKAKRLSGDDNVVLGWRPAIAQLVPDSRWKLLQKLGEGGFGEVWLGQHEVLKEKRVFKFCFQADLIRSLKRELTLFRILKEKIGEHPNIAAIREFNFETAPFYIEMDYVPGHDLKAWCDAQGGPSKISEPEKLEVIAQIADALQAAHQCGIIHRDVKPGNILISNSKPFAAKLTDFGIGQVLSEEFLAGTTRAGFTQTMMGSSSSGTGTQMYMAPELLAGKPASPRSDIYSLGVVLHQLLIGDFSQAVTIDWARRIEDPLLRDDLEKCLAGDPRERFAEARELAANLRALAQRRADSAVRQKSAARGRLARRTMAGLALVMAISMLALFAYKQGGEKETSTPLIKMAVLPLVNLSSVTNEYFADEMTDDLIVKLGQISGLRVIGRATVAPFKKTTNSMPEIARQLNVDAVVRGTLSRTGDKFQLGVRLFDGATDLPLWPANRERHLREVFALQNEVALAIAAKLNVPLQPEVRARFTNAPLVDPEALDLYYHGKELEIKTDNANNKEAIRLYTRAVEITKDFAPAWAALAGANIDRFYHYDPQNYKELKGNAQTAVLQALQLDPFLAEAKVHHALLYWNAWSKFQHEEALSLFDRALQLNPSSVDALTWMGRVYSHTGFLDEAIILAQTGAALEPAGGPNLLNMAYSLVWKGDYKQALLLFPKVRAETHPSLCGSHWAWALFADGQTAQAAQKLQEYVSRNSNDSPGEITAMNALLLAAAGDQAGALAQLQVAEKKTEASFGETHHTTYFMACAYTRLNKREEALKWLVQSADTGYPCYPVFRDDPNLDGLRSHPGFKAFLEKQETDWNKRKVAWAKFATVGKNPAVK